MILRILKINDYRAWVYLFFLTLVMGILAALLCRYHFDLFSDTVASFVFNRENQPAPEKWWFSVLGVLLLVGNVLLFDYVLSTEELIEKNNHVPAFLLGLYFSFALQENPLHPQLFAQLLLTLSYKLFISTYRVERAAPAIFDGAFCLACAVIIFPSYWVFFALGFICLGVMRPFNFREYNLVLLGIGLPYFFYYVLLFLFNGDLHKPLNDITHSLNTFKMPVYHKGSFLINFTSVLVVVFTCIYFISRPGAAKMKTQKALTVFIWTLLPCVGAMFITHNHNVFTGQMAVMPISLFAGIYFGSAKRRILAEILMLLLIAIVLISMMQHAGNEFLNLG